MGKGPGPVPGRPQSAILVPVPDAEVVLAAWRRHHLSPPGPFASHPPAHITLVVPWIEPDRITGDHVEELRALAASMAPWDFSLEGVGLFGTRVIWLAPDPAEEFRRLTAILAGRFATPPYAGDFDEVVPHLTVAVAAEGGVLSEDTDALAAELPIRCRAEELWVMVGDGTSWERRAAVGLGPAAPAV